MNSQRTRFFNVSQFLLKFVIIKPHKNCIQMYYYSKTFDLHTVIWIWDTLLLKHVNAVIEIYVYYAISWCYTIVNLNVQNSFFHTTKYIQQNSNVVVYLRSKQFVHTFSMAWILTSFSLYTEEKREKSKLTLINKFRNDSTQKFISRNW